MFSKTLALIALLSSNAAARLNEVSMPVDSIEDTVSEHLDLEIIINGERELFPLLPGTKCPTGYNCRVRTTGNTLGQSPMISSLKSNLKNPLQMTMEWEELNHDLYTVVEDSNRCNRRHAMAKAAGLVAGLSAAAVNQPAYAAETAEVKMGSDSGLLAFVPNKTTICKGDSVKWIMNKAGPHNVVFDEDAIPDGVDQEAISMTEQIGDEGETFVMKFDTPGTYSYYCEPHRGAGMQATLVVV